jgi:M6 family metalloprotease-like protein
VLTELCQLTDAAGCAVDDDRDVVWFVQADGTLGSVTLDGTRTDHQTLAAGPVSIAVNGTALVVAHGDGRISTLNPHDPGGPATAGVDTGRRLGQLTLSTAGTAAVISSGSRGARPVPIGERVRVPVRDRIPGRILRPTAVPGPLWPGRFLRQADTELALVDLASGSVTERDLDGLTGVAVGGKTAYVATSDLLRRGRIAVVRGSTTQTLAGSLPAPGRLGLAERGAVLLLAHPASNRLTSLRPATGEVTTVTTTAAGRVIEAHGLADGRIVVLTVDRLAVIDALADLRNDPAIEPPAAPLFVGSWVELDFDLGDSGLGRSDVHFAIPDGPDAGLVSYTRHDDAADPIALLVAGGRPGEYSVQLIANATGTVLAETRYQVTDHWDDAQTGPSAVYTSTTGSFDGNGWGGGPAAPQNIGTSPHVGQWRALVLMVDTSDRRWPSDGPTMSANRTAILGHVTTGIPFGGDTRSARGYYEENSQYAAASGGSPERGLTLAVQGNQTYGPVALPGGWTDYFAQSVDDSGTVTDDRWSSQGSTLQTIITRSITDGITTAADWAAVDVVIVVVCSADATGGRPARFVWPHAQSPQEYLCGTNPSTDKRQLAKVFVPLDFDVHDGRQMHTTLSHELGHTLGLPDLYDFPEYSDDVTNRLTGGWDMMAGSRDTLPHYTLSNKMRMNWIPATQLKLFNFQGSGAVTEDVTIYAAELGDPPAGAVKGIEIRLGDGWNYYVEYRAEQATQVSDDLPTDRRVVITDVTSETFTAPLARPPILFVRNDIDGDGPRIGTGADFEEKDPGTQQDLKVEVVSTDADRAVVRVSYGAGGKPEPGIRPWDGGPSWQSPDIEIRNDRATAEPSRYFNTPWLGHDNTVIAKVRNAGDLPATGVVVDFFVTEYSSGDGPWIPLPSDTRNVPAGATVEFSAPWNPPDADGRHYCVIVRIRLYQDPGNLAVIDQNIYNNEARSNYTSFVSASASPSSRVGAEVLLANPFSDSTQVYADVKKTHPQHRVFVDHQWLRVDGRGQRPIRVWDEALWGTPEWSQIGDDRQKRSPSYLWEVPNRVSITGWAARPFETDCGAKTLTGGVGMQVGAGRATRIDIRGFKPTYLAGRVSHVDDGSPVTSGGTVLIELSDGRRSHTVTADVRGDGTFVTEFSDRYQDRLAWGRADYLGGYGAAPSTTGQIRPD